LLDENLQAHNLQIIYEGGKKSFLKWGRKSGLFFVIGVLTGDQPIVICEGFATGASIALAAGLPVVVAFDSGNLPPVAQKIRALFPGRELLIAGDDDAETPGNPGVAKAKEAAGLVGAKFVFPEFKTE